MILLLAQQKLNLRFTSTKSELFGPIFVRQSLEVRFVVSKCCSWWWISDVGNTHDMFTSIGRSLKVECRVFEPNMFFAKKIKH